MQDLAIKPMRQQWTKSKSRELRKEEKKEAAQRAAEIEQKQMLPTGFGCGDLRAELQRLLAVLCQPAQVFSAGTATRPLKGPLNVPQSPSCYQAQSR